MKPGRFNSAINSCRAGIGGEFCDDRWPDFAGSRVGARVPTSDKQYLQYSQDDPAIAFLCDAKNARVPEAWAKLRKTEACKTEVEPLDIILLNKRTSCGNDPNIVGCRNGSLLQLNGSDYSYYIDTPSQIVAGNGSILVDFSLVVTHEVGHWVGLGHLPEPGGIMGEYAAEDRCIDRSSIEQLKKVSAGVVPPDNKPSSLKLVRPH